MCGATAQSFYAPGSQQAQLALAALANFGCYVQNGGFLTPPAFGTIGNAGKNIFRTLPYYNWDLSISKDWKFKERFGAQFRAEFFNILNRADYAVPGRHRSGKGLIRPVQRDSGHGGEQLRAWFRRTAGHPVRLEAQLLARQASSNNKRGGLNSVIR